MKTYILQILAVFSISFGIAQQSSSINFVIRNVGVSVDGHFNTFTVKTSFDALNSLQKLSGEIQVTSIETGIDSRDEHLLKDDYFHASKFPVITLKSIVLEKTASNQYAAKVNLTIKGKTKQITIPVTVTTTNSARKITSKFEINRRDFGVGGRSFVMSDTVKISVVHIENINVQN